MGRRTATTNPLNAREATVNLLFDMSSLPQALVTADGVIAIANDAFAQLVDTEEAEGLAVTDTPLNVCVPDLIAALRRVCEHARPTELRVCVYGGDGSTRAMSIWLAPLIGAHVHVLVREEKLAA